MPSPDDGLADSPRDLGIQLNMGVQWKERFDLLDCYE